MNIILYLLSIIQYLYQQNCWLINFICRYIPLKQWAFDDSHSPNYQKFRVDQLPKIQIIHHEWDWCLLIPYFEHRYNVKIKPVSRRKECDIPQDCSCPSCGAPQPYLYRNNGKAGQLKCKVCNTNFSPGENRFAKQFTLRCPHCGKALAAKKERKHFILHKCVNPKCPYYLHNLKKVDKADRNEDYGKNKYKLHYIYRQFTIDFFRMELSSLPKNASSLKFSKHNAHVMSLCLTLHINLGLSLRKTRQALKDLYNINISHQQIANYCKTAAICIKLIADGYSAYPLAAMEFAKKFGEDFTFQVTQVLGLTNDDAVSKEHRPFKQIVERLNRTYKASYRKTNGFDNIEGANYDLTLWVTYYNFLRPHAHNNGNVLNDVELLHGADNMPGKWQLLIFLGQQTILTMQKNGAAAQERSCCQ